MIFQKKIFSLNNKKVVLLFVGWKSYIWQFYFVILVLLLNGFDCVVYEYTSDILSTNTERTIALFNFVSNDVLKTINQFKEKRYKDISIFGTSLGTILSLIVANKTKSINKIILNLTGSSLAKTVWTWDTINSIFKQKLIDSGITLKSLEKYWNSLAPINNIDNLTDKQMLIYLARKDEVIPFSQGMELVREMNRKSIQYELVLNKKGNHILSGLVNLLKYNKYISFLKR